MQSNNIDSPPPPLPIHVIQATISTAATLLHPSIISLTHMCALAEAQDGVVIKGKSFDFETCKGINLISQSVRCMCVVYDTCRV
jgi:hypothetical protein